MRIIARKTLQTFWTKYRPSEKHLRAWYHEARIARWKSFDDIRKQYPSADVLAGNRVVFDIKGNSFRLVVRIHYNTGIVFIRFIGTHAEYDKLNADTL
jgi:mRNA interferase HigB